MGSFRDIFDRAAELKGGTAALEKLLPVTKSRSELEATPDHRYLAGMTVLVTPSAGGTAGTAALSGCAALSATDGVTRTVMKAAATAAYRDVKCIAALIAQGRVFNSLGSTAALDSRDRPTL